MSFTDGFCSFPLTYVTCNVKVFFFCFTCKYNLYFDVQTSIKEAVVPEEPMT